MLVHLYHRLRDWFLWRQSVQSLEALNDRLLDDLGTDRDHIREFAWRSIAVAAAIPQPRNDKRAAPRLETARYGTQC